MPKCYAIEQSARKVQGAAPLLGNMAKVAVFRGNVTRIPYPEELTAAVRRQEAAPLMDLIHESGSAAGHGEDSRNENKRNTEGKPCPMSWLSELLIFAVMLPSSSSRYAD